MNRHMISSMDTTFLEQLRYETTMITPNFYMKKKHEKTMITLNLYMKKKHETWKIQNAIHEFGNKAEKRVLANIGRHDM